MSSSLDALTAERDRVESEMDKLEQENTNLDQRGAALAERRAAAESAGEDLTKLKIEAEQLAEGKKMTERQLSQINKRFNDVQEEITMLQQSSIV